MKVISILGQQRTIHHFLGFLTVLMRQTLQRSLKAKLYWQHNRTKIYLAFTKVIPQSLAY